MTFRDVDYDIRKLNSLVLRIILGVVLYFIYDISTVNAFGSNVYIFTGISYYILLLLNFFYVKSNHKGKIRLILDLAFIGVFLYNKDLSSTINYLPYIILLSNISSHSNKNSNILLFAILIHLSILLTNNFRFIWTFHLIPLLFYCFVAFYFGRRYFRKVNEEIITSVGDLFIDNIDENTNHHILKKVRDFLKNRPLLSRFVPIKNIYLFIIKDQNLVLIKGSNFVKLDPKMPDEEIKKLFEFVGQNKKSLHKSKRIDINGEEFNNILWLKHLIQDQQYLFLLTLNQPPYITTEKVVLSLRPVFDYIGRIFFLSNSLSKLKKQQLDVIKEKVTYVLDAQNAIHYVKNKLSPITRTIDLVNRLYNDDGLSNKKKNYIINKLKNNNNNGQLKGILKKADLLIKGIDNLLDEENESVSFRRVIDIVRQNWIYYFDSTEAVTVLIEELSGLEVSFNSMLFEFVFTDIIENQNKYHDQLKEVIFDRDDKFVNIRFVNDIKDFDRNYSKLKEITEQYNHKDNDEIYSRKTHGLSFIRRLLRRKMIENEISIDKDQKLFIFKITMELL